VRLIIVGPPSTKKTSQRIIFNKKTGKMMVIGSSKSRSWETDAVDQLCRQWRGLPMVEPVSVRALIYRDRNAGDLTGFIQAIGDALQGGGSRKRSKRVPCVLDDDSQIISWDGSRKLIDRENPRVELTIEPMGPL